MIALFTNWIKYIIFVVLFASFLELLLPSSSMQRFVRVIMGLFIMLAILNPMIDVIQNHVLQDQVTAISTSSANYTSIMDNAKTTARDRDQLSTEIYKKELAQQMRVMISALEGVADASVVVDIKPIDSNKTSNIINSVVVYVKPGSANNNIKIAKVSIGKSAEPTTDSYLQLQDKVRKMIIELYQLPKEAVEVKILHT